MRILLALLLLVTTASDVFALDLSLGPGLSAKNALLDATAALLAIRIVLQGGVKLELPSIAVSYAIMFAYALISVFVAALIIQYPHYRVTGGIMSLKQSVLDPALMHLTFFYGIRTLNDSKVLIKTLLAAFTVASILTITNVYGYTDVGEMRLGDNNAYEAGRVYGFFGHANETGALIAVLLPAYLAVVLSSRGIARLAWTTAMMISVVVLIMTGSRGALAGLFVGGAIAAFVCRRYFSLAAAARMGVRLLVIGLPIIILLGAKYGAEFLQRVVDQASSADVNDVSSGRLDLWMDAIGTMMDAPITLITGFGWNVYDSMGFRLIPHNHYIFLWFELGLVGLGCYLAVIYTMTRAALDAMPSPDLVARSYMIAFVFSIMILSVALCFEQFFKPWLYVWPYAGLMLRVAVAANPGKQPSATASMTNEKPVAERFVRKLGSRQA